MPPYSVSVTGPGVGNTWWASKGNILVGEQRERDPADTD